MREPIRCNRPSRCHYCATDLRRGELILYVPHDARPGQPRKWIHERCDR